MQLLRRWRAPAAGRTGAWRPAISERKQGSGQAQCRLLAFGPPGAAKNGGFTLIELITVVVLLGVLGVLGADFISRGFQGFKATDSRMAIYEEGKLALVRMELEIHNGVPNGVDSATLAGDPTDLRFGMLNEKAMSIAANVFGSYLENPPTTALTDLTGPLPVNTIISIYNRDWDDLTNPVAAQRRLYTVAAVAGNTMTISKNLTPPRSSPQKRYYAVDRALRYYLAGTSLMRSQLPIIAEDLDFNNLGSQPGFPLARHIQPGSLRFSYSPATLTRTGVVTINFTIAADGELVNFHKEVHIRNVP